MGGHNQKIGKDGEELACTFLVKNGFVIKDRNWRFGHLEVDIFAYKESILHIVEVKTRTTIKYGLPEETVTTKKFRLLQDAAVAYLDLYPEFTKIQFDILAITILPNEPIDYFYIEDYFLK
jgi:putative endonuclease